MLKKIQIFLIFLFFITANAFSQKNLDSLQHELYTILESGNYDSTSLKFVEKVFYDNIEINSLRASEVAAIGIQIAENLGDSVLIARMQNLRGQSILKQKTFFMAIQIFFENYSLFRKYNAKKDMANTLLLISRVYLEQGIADIAGQKVVEAMKIYRQLGDSIGIADSYKIMGLTYLENEEETAIDYFKKAEKIYKKESENYKLAKTYLLMGKAYLNMEKTNFAVNYFSKSLIIFKKLNKKISLAKTYIAIGDVFYYDKVFKKAQRYYQKAKSIYSSYKVANKIIEIDIKIAQVLYHFENYYMAVSIADSARSNAELYNERYLLSEAYRVIADCYVEINDMQKAHNYRKKYAQSLNDYYQEKSSGDFSLFQMNLETQNKENELKMLQMKSKQEKLRLANEQYQRNKIFAAIILFLVILYLVFIYFRTRERKKNAKSLKKTNYLLQQEIEERKKAELESTSNEERYKLLFSQTPIGILQFDENLSITNVNKRFAEIFHKNADDISQKHINVIFDRNTVKKISKLLHSNEQIIKFRTDIPTSKEVVFVSVTVKKYKIWINEEEIKGGIIIVEDFTEHKKAERYYKANILMKQMLVNHIPDDLILLDQNENIVEIHFPDYPEREVGVSKLSDIFKDSTLSVFRTHIINAKNNKKISQFFFSDSDENFLVRIIPTDKNFMLIISKFEGEAQDAGIILKEKSIKNKTDVDKYIKNIQNDIEKELLPIYQNIQRGLSFIMIKNFAEKIIALGENYNNNKIKDFGEKLLDHVTSFNVFKVNQVIDEFPAFISQFMGISAKF